MLPPGIHSLALEVLHDLRRFWFYVVPLWVLPLPILFVSLWQGAILIAAPVIPTLGLWAALPLIRGDMRLPSSYVLLGAAPLASWFAIAALCGLLWYL
jgi:hypothetical protein